MKIDSHHHFWKYDPVAYDWISSEMEAIRRDFLPADLEKEIHGVGIEGVISVQARTTLEETHWLLDLASRHDFIRGVVGWVPLDTPDLHEKLDELSAFPKLRSVREICQGQPAGFMLRPEFLRGIGLLEEADLAYDVLIFEEQLPEASAMIDRFPNQSFILDHLAKPRIREGSIARWEAALREMARRENVYCKLSGMVTEADWTQWTVAQLRPYIEIVLEAFGPGRVLFGSDWPVCLVASGYRQWFEAVREVTATLSPDEQNLIFGGNAVQVYRLESPE